MFFYYDDNFKRGIPTSCVNDELIAADGEETDQLVRGLTSSSDYCAWHILLDPVVLWTIMPTFLQVVLLNDPMLFFHNYDCSFSKSLLFLYFACLN